MKFFGVLAAALAIVTLGAATAEEVTVKEVAPVKFACMAGQGDFSQIPATFEQLFKWVEAKEVKPAGAPFGMYYDNPKVVPIDSCKWELCVPIAADIEGDSLAQVKSLDKAEVAFIVHKGAHDKVAPAWETLYDWISSNGYVPTGTGMEVYLKCPKEVPEDSLLTEIRVPVTKKEPAPEKTEEE
jgi:AraC family transcriptional regulator